MFIAGPANQNLPSVLPPIARLVCQESVPRPIHNLKLALDRDQSTVRLNSVAIAQGQMSSARRNLGNIYEDNRGALLENIKVGRDELVQTSLVEVMRYESQVSFSSYKVVYNLTRSYSSAICSIVP